MPRVVQFSPDEHINTSTKFKILRTRPRAKLRKRIGMELIENVFGRGYKLSMSRKDLMNLLHPHPEDLEPLKLVA